MISFVGAFNPLIVTIFCSTWPTSIVGYIFMRWQELAADGGSGRLAECCLPQSFVQALRQAAKTEIEPRFTLGSKSR